MAIVGKIDVHLDRAAKHTLSVRGTLADNHRRSDPGAVAGARPASTLRDNSKGFAAQYNGGLANKPDQCFECEYTRFGQALSGVTGPLTIPNESRSAAESLRASVRSDLAHAESER